MRLRTAIGAFALTFGLASCVQENTLERRPQAGKVIDDEDNNDDNNEDPGDENIDKETPGEENQGFDETLLTDVAVQSFKVGQNTDAQVNLTAGNGGLLLMGGGTDVDSAFATRVRGHVGAGADVVVLRATGTDGYNDYLMGLLQANSVETFIVDSKDKANSRQLYTAIKNAEFIWLAGGDQSQYHGFWTGTAAQYYIQDLYTRGGVIGGTSAGMATLAPISYNPAGVLGAVSDEVVPDFCHETVKFAYNFLKTDFPAFLTDTHFAERDRMGRIATFLAHHPQMTPTGIAADEGTSIFFPQSGLGIVDGVGSVYILNTKAADFSNSACGGPTVATGMEKIKLIEGQTYDIKTGVTTGTSTPFNVDGNDAQFYDPQDPYQ